MGALFTAAVPGHFSPAEIHSKKVEQKLPSVRSQQDHCTVPQLVSLTFNHYRLIVRWPEDTQLVKLGRGRQPQRRRTKLALLSTL